MINNTEAVAWRYLTRNGWSVTTVKGVADFQQSEGCVVEPLYTALAQSDVEPIARARYHLQAADHALHEVEGDPFADHAHTLVHEAAFMITDEPELQVLRRLPESSAVLAQSDAEPKDRRIEELERQVSDLRLEAQEDAREIDELLAALAQSDAEPVAVTNEMVNAACDILFERTSIAFGGTYMREALEAALHPNARGKHYPPLAQSDSADFLGQMRATEFLGGPSDAEPVAWRYAYPGYPGHWNVTSDKLTVDERQGNAGCIIEPLYTTTPRPDASAGLIEAAANSVNARDIATKIASRPALAKLIDTGALKFDEMCDLRDDIEKALRSRAADRSWK